MWVRWAGYVARIFLLPQEENARRVFGVEM